MGKSGYSIAVWLKKSGPFSSISVPFAETDRAVLTVVFHSTALRSSQFEVKVQVPFLKDGAFIAQSIATYPTVRAIRKLGALNAAQLANVEAAVFKWLGRTA